MNCKTNNFRKRYRERKKIRHSTRLKMLEEIYPYLDSI